MVKKRQLKKLLPEAVELMRRMGWMGSTAKKEVERFKREAVACFRSPKKGECVESTTLALDDGVTMAFSPRSPNTFFFLSGSRSDHLGRFGEWEKARHCKGGHVARSFELKYSRSDLDTFKAVEIVTFQERNA